MADIARALTDSFFTIHGPLPPSNHPSAEHHPMWTGPASDSPEWLRDNARLIDAITRAEVTRGGLAAAGWSDIGTIADDGLTTRPSDTDGSETIPTQCHHPLVTLRTERPWRTGTPTEHHPITLRYSHTHTVTIPSPRTEHHPPRHQTAAPTWGPVGPLPTPPRRHMAETANSALYAFQESRRARATQALSCGYSIATSEYSSEHGLRHSYRHSRHPVAERY